jgi:hypothetical protein
MAKVFDPIIGYKTHGEWVLNKEEGNPWVMECPSCKNTLSGVLVLDVMSGTKGIVKKSDWNPKKTWIKKIKTNVFELRNADDIKSLSVRNAEAIGSSILWEVIRGLKIEMPKKPKAKDMDKTTYLTAKKAYSNEWKKAFNREDSIADLFRKMSMDLNPGLAKERTRAILTALKIDLSKAKMNDKFKLVSMASKISDMRTKAAVDMVTRLSKSAPLSAWIKGIKVNPNDYISSDTSRDKVRAIRQMHESVLKTLIATERMGGFAKGREMIKLVEERIKELTPRPTAFLEPVLKALYNMDLGDIIIRGTAIAKIKHIVESRNGNGMFAIHMGNYKPFEKNTRKYKEFIAEHAKDFFENPAYSMDRGKPIVQDDGSAFIYDPTWDGMVQVMGPGGDLHHVSYNESYGDEDFSDESVLDKIAVEDGIFETAEDEYLIETRFVNPDEYEEEIEAA